MKKIVKYSIGIILIILFGLGAYNTWSTNMLIYNLQFENQGGIIRSDRFAMQKGTYVMVVRYHCDTTGNSMRIYSPTTMNDNGTVGHLYGIQELKPNETRAALTIHFEDAVTNLEMQVSSNDPTLIIDEMVYRPLDRQNDAFIVYIGILLSGFLFIWIYHKNSKEDVGKNVIALYLIVLTGITMLPYMNDFLISGHDIAFHLSRIEGTYKSIISGQFPVRINVSQLYGYGYASPITYPQLFIYIPAFFRILGLSLLNCYKLLLLIINILTVVCAYFSFKNIFRLKYAGIIGSTFYMLSIYRLNNIYIRAAIGEALGMIFLPLIFWGIYEIIYRDYKKWWLAAIGITGVYQSHLITTEMVFIAIFIVCLLSIRRFFSESARIGAIVKAATVTILINLWSILPLASYLSEKFIALNDENRKIPSEALYFSQMFTTFVRGGEQLLDTLSRERGSTQGEMPLTLGLSLVLGTVLYFSIINIKKARGLKNKLPAKWLLISNFAVITSIILLIMTSWLFPLELLMKIGIVGKILDSFQIIWRLLSPISFLLSLVATTGVLCAMLSFKKHKYLVLGTSLAVTLLSSVYCIDSTVQYESYSNIDVMATVMSADEMYLYDRADRIGVAERGGGSYVKRCQYSSDGI